MAETTTKKRSKGKNAVQLIQEMTPEERKISSQKAARAHSENARKRREEALKLAKVSETLTEAAELILRSGGKDTSLAYEVIKGVADIAENGSNEKNRLTAADLLSKISGQTAATQIRVGNLDNRPFETIDLTALSDEEIRKLIEREEREATAQQIVAEAEAVSVEDA